MQRAQKRGARLATFAADVSRTDDLQRLFSEIHRSLPPLRGVFHVAGALDDGILVQQNWNRFERPLEPKVRGSWELRA